MAADIKSKGLIFTSWFFVLFFSLLFAADARGTWNKASVLKMIEVAAPQSGVEKMEVLKADSKEIYAGVINYGGGPLPPERSIVIELGLRGPDRVLATYVPGGILGPYWTSPVWTDSLGNLPRWTQFALWQEPSGEWAAMIPLVGGGMRSMLEGCGQGPCVVADSFHPGFAPDRVPLFALGRDTDPYRLVKELYAFGFKVMREVDPEGVIGKLRREKEFPEILDYVGWCSWNAHYRYVTQADLFEHAKSFNAAGFPIRWMLIDDGWQSITKQKLLPWSQGGLYMTGFTANDKFPGGLSQTVNILKDEHDITWVGVWHTFQGYWNGIALDSELGREYHDALLPVSDEAAIPDPRSDAGERFWQDWYASLEGSGIDFVKVDNQSTLSSLVSNVLPVSTAMARAQKNLQAAARDHFDSNLINCMEMNIDVVYQWETTNIGRSSGDYVPILPHNPRTHVVKNVINALWISNLVYPDYDMFSTHDQHPEYHGVARAISGGPVYITDKAGRERFEYLWPLVLADGKLIRVDEPGLPVVKNLLADPFIDRVALMAFAGVNEAGVLALWNVDKYERPVTALVSPSDVHGISGERFAVYEHFTQELRLMGRDDEFEARLSRWDVRLYSVAPIEDGFAAIGLVNKYVSPGTVIQVSRHADRVTVVLSDAGQFAAWSEREPKTIEVNGSAVSRNKVVYTDGFLKVDVPKAHGGNQKIRLDIIW